MKQHRKLSLVAAAFTSLFYFYPVAAVEPTAALNLSIKADRGSVTRPGSLRLTLTVSNIGSATATGVKVSDSLPLGWVYGDATIPAQFKDIGALNPGAVRSIIVPITVTERSPLTQLAYEAIVSADNATAVESFAAVTVTTGRVLGAADQLASTGTNKLTILVGSLGPLFLLAGILLRRRQLKNT